MKCILWVLCIFLLHSCATKNNYSESHFDPQKSCCEKNTDNVVCRDGLVVRENKASDQSYFEYFWGALIDTVEENQQLEKQKYPWLPDSNKKHEH